MEGSSVLCFVARWAVEGSTAHHEAFPPDSTPLRVYLTQFSFCNDSCTTRSSTLLHDNNYRSECTMRLGVTTARSKALLETLRLAEVDVCRFAIMEDFKFRPRHLLRLRRSWIARRARYMW